MLFKENNYKAIFFDLDGTLRHTVPLGADMYFEKLGEYGASLDSEKHIAAGRWEHYYWASSPELRDDIETYEEDQEGFWNNYMNLRMEKMGVTPEEAEVFRPMLSKFFEEEYEPEDWVPPELHEVLPALRERGYILAVLSNRRSVFEDLMKEIGLYDYFDAIMAAGEVGKWKPNPEVFDKLLTRFSLAPRQTIYVGDNYYADVVGARNAGISPLLYDPREIFPDPDCPKITDFHALKEFL